MAEWEIRSKTPAVAASKLGLDTGSRVRIKFRSEVREFLWE